MTQESQEQSTETKNSGYPEVAGNKKQKNPFMLVILSIIVVFFIIGFFVMRHSGTKENQTEQQAQESYDVSSSAKLSVSSATAKTQVMQAQKIPQISDQEKLERLRAQTILQAHELLEHQVSMAQQMAQFLGESTAKGEMLVENLVKLADKPQTAGNDPVKKWRWNTSTSK